MAKHLTMAELEEGMAASGESPDDNGTLEMIVCRPSEGERLVVEQAELDAVAWLQRDLGAEAGR